MIYEIWYGLDKCEYQYEDEFNNPEDANNTAYNDAVCYYQSYEGYHGYLSKDDCRQDLYDSWPHDNWTEEDVEERYKEEVESRIQYKAIPKILSN